MIALVAPGALGSPKIDKLLKEAERKGEYGGSLLVVKDGKVLYEGSVGFANREWSIRHTPDTRFRICSITKQFTSVLVMRLVDSGKIGLDEPVSKYLPWLREETFSRITIRHLLSGSSTLPFLPDPGFYTSTDERFTNYRYVIEKYLSGDLRGEPGREFAYNNGDFIVAGAVIEELYSKPFDTVLKEEILKPLEMRDTGMISSSRLVERLASGYVFEAGAYRKEGFRSIENYGAAGAMYSTLRDMAKWNKALQNSVLISRESTDVMFTSSPELGFVGLGSWIYDLKIDDQKSVKLIERQGAIGGFSALNLLAPNENLSITFLGNVQTRTLFNTYTKNGLSYEVLKAIYS